MDNTWIFRDKLIKVSLFVACIVSVFSMSLMITYAHNKTVITSDEEGTVEVVEESNVNYKEQWSIDISKATNDDANVIISCPGEVSLNDVDVFLRYNTNELYVVIDVNKNHYFLSNLVRGNFTGIDSGKGLFDGEKVIFSFALTDLYECDFSYINKEIQINLIPISDNDKAVVIIDAGHGGQSVGTKAKDVLEKDITLAIAKRVKELSTDSDYKVVLTRSSDYTVTIEERLNIVESLNSSYYIGLHLDSDIENTKQFGMSAVYNAGYYRNGIQNSEFADAILRSVVDEAVNKGNALNEATDNDVILKVTDIPSMDLYCGFMSNADELALLQSDEYITNIAKGILNGLDSVVK